MTEFENWREKIGAGLDIHSVVQKRLSGFPDSQVSAAISEIWKTDPPRTAGSIAGFPFLAKDLFDVSGRKTLASSRVLQAIAEPAVRTAPLIHKFESLGATCVGKTNLVEFAYGLTGTNSYTGDCYHPLAPDRLTGGSSSGSAWAVAAGIVPFALGTDTGGSIRVPAAFCGIYGFRMSPNEFSENDCIPLARTFDSAGWFTKDAADMAELISHFFDVRKSEKTLRVLDLTQAYKDFVDDDLQPGLASLAKKISGETDAGLEAEWREIFSEATFCYSVLTSLEAMEYHKDRVGPYADLYDPDVLPLLLRARKWTDANIQKAENLRSDQKDFMREIFEAYNVVLLPAVPCVAQKKQDLTKDHRLRILDLNTPASNTQHPALSIPFSISSDSPLTGGIQAILPRKNTASVALAFLNRLNFHSTD